MNLKDIIINFVKQYQIIIIIIVFLVIYFFLNHYMINKKQVIVFDLDETLGCFIQLGAFCDTIEKFNKKKMDFDEFYKLMDLYPEYLRPNILKILTFLKEKREKGDIYKVFIYTNNQGPREWAERIRLFLEKKINYKLFSKIIAAYKVNGKIVETTRTSHDKKVPDFLRSTNLSKNTLICFIDDVYHNEMDTDNVYYIHIDPYHASIPIDILIERYYKQNKRTIPNKNEFANFVYSYMDRYNLPIKTKSIIEKKYDMLVSKELMEHLENFIKITNQNKQDKSKSYKYKSHKKRINYNKKTRKI